MINLRSYRLPHFSSALSTSVFLPLSLRYSYIEQLRENNVNVQYMHVYIHTHYYIHEHYKLLGPSKETHVLFCFVFFLATIPSCHFRLLAFALD